MTPADQSRINGGRRRQHKIRAVEAEFGEPFWDVVRGFAAMGYGKGATADAIEYSRKAFFRLLREYPDEVQWPAYKDLACWQTLEQPADWGKRISTGRRASRKGCRLVKAGGEVMLQTDYARREGISDAQARRHRVAGLVEEVTP